MPETKGRTFDDIARGFAANAEKGLETSGPEAVVTGPPDSRDAIPLSPTEKLPMVDFPQKQ